jgi:enoyl-CoA hydratase/carnithine racemase
MTGDLFAAPDLQAWGVVNRVRPRDTLLADARGYVAGLAAGPTRATAVGKQLLQVARDHGVAAADAVTPHATGQVFATRDLPAGIASLLRDGPRKATFEGR